MDAKEQQIPQNSNISYNLSAAFPKPSLSNYPLTDMILPSTATKP
jgi:hypothetical protein